MRGRNLRGFEGRGVGFGYHKYLFDPFYFNAVINKIAPPLLKRYYGTCFTLERAIGGLIPFRYIMEKFVIKATKNDQAKERRFVSKVVNKLSDLYKKYSGKNITKSKTDKTVTFADSAYEKF